MTWKEEKREAQMDIVDILKDYVVVSGGMAWHMMSPEHTEVKKMHDHSDVDLFIIPSEAWRVFALLKENGYKRWWTRYDNKTPNFSRYGRTVLKGKKRVKVILDLFVQEVPFRMIDGYKVVETKYLLSLYDYSGEGFCDTFSEEKVVHSSGRCWAVRQARRLMANGVDVVGRSELIKEWIE